MLVFNCNSSVEINWDPHFFRHFKVSTFDGSNNSNIISDDSSNESKTPAPTHVTPIVLHNGQPTSIQMGYSDGSGDNHIKGMKAIAKYELYFRLLDLDYLAVSITSSGQSQKNFIKQCMSLLTTALVSHTIPHNYYGEHCSNNKEINEDLCEKNLNYAGQELQYLFNFLKYGKYKYNSKYISKNDDTLLLEAIDNYNIDHVFQQQHVKFGYYLLQFSKCSPAN